MMRDSKGRFVSNKENNNTINNSNVKEIKTMKNSRIETLNNAGVNTNKFFNLNMNLPVGANVTVTVDGVPYDINSEMEPGDVAFDEIAKQIVSEGYVKSSKLFRRWITAQTFRMLNYKSYDGKRSGWDACLHDRYGYEYTFKMMLEEVRVLSILEKEDPEHFAERANFFNKEVVIATVNDYEKKLKKWIHQQPVRGKRKPYVKLSRYGNVYCKNLYNIYHNINIVVSCLRSAKNYTELYNVLNDFMNKIYNKLPYETSKAAAWKDAYKASGAYYSLKNLVMFHGVGIEITVGSVTTMIYGNNAVKYLQDKLNETYSNKAYGEGWRFHYMLKKVIADNNFDLARSIENQKRK